MHQLLDSVEDPSILGKWPILAKVYEDRNKISASLGAGYFMGAGYLTFDLEEGEGPHLILLSSDGVHDTCLWSEIEQMANQYGKFGATPKSIITVLQKYYFAGRTRDPRVKLDDATLAVIKAQYPNDNISERSVYPAQARFKLNQEVGDTKVVGAFVLGGKVYYRVETKAGEEDVFSEEDLKRLSRHQRVDMQESRRNEAKQEQIGIGTSVTVLRNGIYRLEEGWQVADVIIGGDGQTYYVVHGKDGKYQKTVPEKLLHMWQKAYRVKRSSGDREDGWVVGDFSVGNDG